MLSDLEYIRESLELNLFFMRIAKEHSIFIEAAFTAKNTELAEEADAFKNVFSNLLKRAIELSDGILSEEVVGSGELVTDLTLKAEKETEFYTGISINSRITKAELTFTSEEEPGVNPAILHDVNMLNQRALASTHALANYKARLLNDVLACRLFTNNYPLLLDHILREAKFYIRSLIRLQRRKSSKVLYRAVEEEIFWNRIMAEHAKFVRGLLDPTEVKLFDTANDFGHRFDVLTSEAEKIEENISLFSKVTAESLDAAKDIRDFKRQGTQGLTDCTIRSIAYPLLGDHVVREANHYIRILRRYADMSVNKQVQS
jgi:hypothetical protein